MSDTNNYIKKWLEVKDKPEFKAFVSRLSQYGLPSATEAMIDREKHGLALSGKLGDAEKIAAERRDWCAKVAIRTIHTADEIERLLVFSCHGNRSSLLRELGITDMQ